MDDGHQNPTLKKTLSIVVIDAAPPSASGHVFPKGPLREPIARGLARADAVVLMGEGERRPSCAFTSRPARAARRRWQARAGPLCGLRRHRPPGALLRRPAEAWRASSSQKPCPILTTTCSRQSDLDYLMKLVTERDAPPHHHGQGPCAPAAGDEAEGRCALRSKRSSRTKRRSTPCSHACRHDDRSEKPRARSATSARRTSTIAPASASARCGARVVPVGLGLLVSAQGHVDRGSIQLRRRHAATPRPAFQPAPDHDAQSAHGDAEGRRKGAQGNRRRRLGDARPHRRRDASSRQDASL